jgi:hypothetical protein
MNKIEIVHKSRDCDFDIDALFDDNMYKNKLTENEFMKIKQYIFEYFKNKQFYEFKIFKCNTCNKILNAHGHCKMKLFKFYFPDYGCQCVDVNDNSVIQGLNDDSHLNNVVSLMTEVNFSRDVYQVFSIFLNKKKHCYYLWSGEHEMFMLSSRDFVKFKIHNN